MKVLVPGELTYLDTKWILFPGDIEYGTEIFVLNSEKKLTSKDHPITEELDRTREIFD